MPINIYVVVIDDKKLYANRIKNILLQRNEAQDKVFYSIEVFYERNLYTQAHEYFSQCIKNKKYVDLIFSDYHLGGEDGTSGMDFFSLFSNTAFQPFKVLHSNTTKSFYKGSKEFIEGLYDLFIPTKDSDIILKNVIKIENEIFDVKMKGNPQYRSWYYSASGIPKTIKMHGSYELRNILFVDTDDDMKTIVFRKEDFESRIVKLEKAKPTTSMYRISEFLVRVEELPFLQLNQSQLINLLWVSKIDFINKVVRFIPPQSEHLELKIKNSLSAIKNPHKLPLEEISNGLDVYFLRQRRAL